MITSHVIGGNGKDAWNEDLVKIYESSFPEAEKMPYENILRIIEEAEFPVEFLVHEEGGGLTLGQGDLVGLSITAELDDFDWIWYLAVREICRGKGYGKKILQIVKDRCYDASYREKPVIIEIESPDQTICNNPKERERRHKFFLNQGFRDTDVTYERAGILYLIMSNSDLPFTKEDYNKMLETLWKESPYQKP